MQIPTEVAPAVGQPRLASTSEPRHRALTVQLTLEPQRPRSRKHHQARTVIETHCLKPFEVQHQNNGNYHIQVPATSDDQLDEMMDDLIDEIHRIASDKACWVETLITDTAYPRFRTDIPQHELDAVYTPTPNEQRWARRCAKQLQHRFFLLLHLKAYQKQGFFSATVDLPSDIINILLEELVRQRTRRRSKSTDQCFAGITAGDRT